jgi:hypothetical protein
MMAHESGCNHGRYAFLTILAALGLVVWLIVRLTGHNHITFTDKTQI